MDVIKGDEKNRHFHVSFNYTNKKGETGNRWVQVYQLVTTTTGAPAISGYEVSSNISGNANKRPGWKIYLLSNISDFRVSKVPFYNEIDKVNPSIVYNTINSNRNVEHFGLFDSHMNVQHTGLFETHQTSFNNNKTFSVALLSTKFN